MPHLAYKLWFTLVARPNVAPSHLGRIRWFAFGGIMSYTIACLRRFSLACSPYAMRLGRCAAVLALRPRIAGVVAVHHATEPQDPEALELAFFKRGNLDEAGKSGRPDGGIHMRWCGYAATPGRLSGLESLNTGGSRYR